MPLAVPEYRPRAPEQGVLHTIVRTHLEAFLREVAGRADGPGLPARQFPLFPLAARVVCGV